MKCRCLPRELLKKATEVQVACLTLGFDGAWERSLILGRVTRFLARKRGSGYQIGVSGGKSLKPATGIHPPIGQPPAQERTPPKANSPTPLGYLPGVGPRGYGAAGAGDGAGTAGLAGIAGATTGAGGGVGEVPGLAETGGATLVGACTAAGTAGAAATPPDRHSLMNFLRSVPFLSLASALQVFIFSCWGVNAAPAGSPGLPERHSFMKLLRSSPLMDLVFASALQVFIFSC